MSKNYNVEVKEAWGTCESDIFKKMCKMGDITAESITAYVGDIITIDGYAYADVEAGDKIFSMGYYSTDKGFIQTGSVVFLDSIKNYIEDIKTFKIVEVKTTKGKTYKVSPVLNTIGE